MDQPADPEMFGIGNILGNMVTATVLSNMTEDDLARGFKELAIADGKEGGAGPRTGPGQRAVRQLAAALETRTVLTAGT